MFWRSRRVEEVIAFALSGGGSRSAAQVGVLKALSDAGVSASLLTGTSAGAVNAVWCALYPDRLDRLEAIWLALRTRDVFPDGRLGALYNMARRGHVYSARAWESYLRREVGTACFEDMMVRCAVTAVRLSDGKRVILDSGEVVPALMASTAIPGIFPPYPIDGEMYVDGGVLEYLPLPTALERGATTVYAVDCSSFGSAPATAESVVDRCALIGASASVDQVTSLFSTRGRTVHLLRPDLPPVDDARDFKRTCDLIDTGYDCTQRYLQNQAQKHTATTSGGYANTAG